MVLAVNIPEHDPQPGQQLCSMRLASSRVILPEAAAPTAIKALLRSKTSDPCRPASIGPPVTITVGRFSLAAAMAMPGITLSHEGMSTRASKACARATVSTESAISSRDAREYFMP